MAKRKMPVRTQLAELNGDYEGWVANTQLSIPLRIYEKFYDLQQRAAQMDEGQLVDIMPFREIMNSILISPWNFVDVNGDPMGEPFKGETPEGFEGPWSAPTPEAIQDLPVDLLFSVFRAFGERTGDLPEE